MAFSLTCLYYIVTGIQFWMTQYLIDIIKETETIVKLTFAFVCITSPTGGAVFSGYLSSWIGGYESKNAIPTCLVLAALAFSVAAPSPYVDDFVLVITLLWLFLFIGGILVPLMTGIMLASVEPELRP